MYAIWIGDKSGGENVCVMMCLLLLLMMLGVICIIVWVQRRGSLYGHRKEYVTERIPKIVHQTWKVKDSSDGFHRSLIDRHEKMNPNWKFVLYDDEDIENFLMMYFPMEILDAYKKINPKYGACRADFFRYCVLYINGGVYLDVKSMIQKPLDEMMIRRQVSDDLLVVGHWNNSNVWSEILEDPRGEIQNWVIMSTPRHPILLRVIEKMVDNIFKFSDDFGDDYRMVLGQKYAASKSKYIVLKLTGPLMFSEILWKHRDDSSLLVDDKLIREYFEYMGYREYVREYRKVDAMHYSLLTERVLRY